MGNRSRQSAWRLKNLVRANRRARELAARKADAVAAAEAAGDGDGGGGGDQAALDEAMRAIEAAVDADRQAEEAYWTWMRG